MNTAIIISSFISALLLLITIFYNGGLRKTENSLSFKEQVNSLNYMGKSVVIIVLLLATADPTISVINNYNANEDYKKDTIRLTDLINELQEQKTEYINKIDSLTILTITNNDSINSINRNIIQVAADEIKERQKLKEQHNEYLFSQLKDELLENSRFLTFSIDSTILLNFINSNYFIYARPKHEFLDKYIEITSNKSLFNILLTSSKLLIKINDYCNSASRSNDIIRKESSIRTIIKNGKDAEILILYLFNKSDSIDSYKEFEKIDYSTIDLNVTESIKNNIKNRTNKTKEILDSYYKSKQN